MSLASGDLTTLATAKIYVDPLPSDQVLGGLITRVSRMVHGCLNRSLLVPKSYIEQYNGTGTQSLVLAHYPLISLESLIVSGVTYNIAPQANVTTPASFGDPWGYRFQPWNGIPPGGPAIVELVGGLWYYRGNQNVVATYSAGYQVSGETQTIPATTPFTIVPNTPYGIWATDEGVTFTATGVALTPVANNPGSGEYVPPNPNAATPIAYYTFAAADTGLGVTLNYGFIPSDIEQVVLELISERASYRKRVGVRSQSLAGQEVITYETGALSKWAMEALAPYINVLPPPIGANV